MTAATKREIRSRFKAMREGKPYDPPAIHADKLAVQLVAAANSDRAPISRAERMHVEAAFHYRFVELCRTTPVGVRRP